jgi:hypothetical protein
VHRFSTLALLATLALLLAGSSTPTCAQEMILQGGLGIGLTALDDAVATVPHAGGFGVYLDLTPHFFNVAAVRAEGGLTFLEPLCFNEDAECPEHDEQFVALSGALGAGIVPPGLRLFPGVRLDPSLFAGNEWMTGWRGARYCVNCFEENLRLRGGLFVEPGVELVVGRVGLAASYRAYHPHADVRGRVVVRLFSRSK